MFLIFATIRNFRMLTNATNASEFLAINANLLKIAFGRAFAREIQYMGEHYNQQKKTIHTAERFNYLGKKGISLSDRKNEY